MTLINKNHFNCKMNSKPIFKKSSVYIFWRVDRIKKHINSSAHLTIGNTLSSRVTKDRFAKTCFLCGFLEYATRFYHLLLTAPQATRLHRKNLGQHRYMYAYTPDAFLNVKPEKLIRANNSHTIKCFTYKNSIQTLTFHKWQLAFIF